MVQLNQSLEDPSQVGRHGTLLAHKKDSRDSNQDYTQDRTHSSSNANDSRQQTLKESRSHDRVTMLSRLTTHKGLNMQANLASMVDVAAMTRLKDRGTH